MLLNSWHLNYILLFTAHNAKTSVDESDSGLKANLNGHPLQKMSFNSDLN